jgi:amino acid transporter
VNNLFYFPSVLLFGAANFAAMGGARWQGLGDSRWFAVVFVLTGIWIAALVSIVGLRTGKWLQNVGTAGVWVPAGLLIGCGLFAAMRYGSATSFTASAMKPRGEFLDTIGLWSAMCFAFSGLEITSFVGQEIRRPERTIPLGVLIAGLATTVIYIAGSASVLAAVPFESLKELSGITDAVQLVTARVGITGIGALTGALLTLNALAGAASWTAGAARVPFAAGVDAALPPAFARLHPRFRTPHVALIVQSLASTLIFLASLFITVAGRTTSIQDAYDILVNLTILIYFVPYLYLFAALVWLRRVPGDAGALIPGGPAAIWGVAAIGFAATLIAIVLTFVPPPGANVMTFEGNLIVQALLMLGLGGLLYRFNGRR